MWRHRYEQYILYFTACAVNTPFLPLFIQFFLILFCTSPSLSTSLPLSHTNTHTHTLSHAHAHTLPHTHSLSHTHNLSVSLSHRQSPSQWRGTFPCPWCRHHSSQTFKNDWLVPCNRRSFCSSRENKIRMNYTDQSIIPILVVMPSIHYFLKWKLRKITNENIIFCEENTLFTKKNTAFWKYRINEGNTVLTVNVCNQCRIELPTFTLCVLPCQHLSCFVKSSQVMSYEIMLVLFWLSQAVECGLEIRTDTEKIK